MTLRLTAASAAACLLAFATSAAAPVPQPTHVAAGSALFRCEGDTCVAQSAIRSNMNVDTCKALARRVGRVTAFGSSVSALDERMLARCNTAAS